MNIKIVSMAVAKVGDIIEYNNLKWYVQSVENVYNYRDYPKEIIADRIIKKGKAIGKQTICYQSDKPLLSIHRYRN